MIRSVVLSIGGLPAIQARIGARVRKTELVLPRLCAHGTVVSDRIGKYSGAAYFNAYRCARRPGRVPAGPAGLLPRGKPRERTGLLLQ